ncbi:MAG: PadR family transcriptional regulator [Candidatus Korarchaeota archaeon]|nr:PadR family transcriptional regulator [Candidatus Korarchaeota archaeon]NIU85636.1 hypothetical protein [Candidatus Thorarchaeota archaeon]NIW12948.1 hypothetical protein [Candidatus Thorarchaeota archaeon]NIW51093.1 hypothetical protein [Candidatus Korarchaeota archaeon]
MCDENHAYHRPRHPTHSPGRGFVETLILWIIHKEPLHGYGVKKEIISLPIPYKPKPGAIYTILRRMEKKGLLTSAWDERPAKKDRRVYQITEEGEHLLASRLEVMQTRVKLLQKMLNYYDKHFDSKSKET